jgi:hypothetical protein
MPVIRYFDEEGNVIVSVCAERVEDLYPPFVPENISFEIEETENV